MGREVLIVKVEYVVRPDPWCLKTHMENFSRIQKATESQCSYLWFFVFFFAFEKRKDYLLENYSAD